jgi:hypothetical protein
MVAALLPKCLSFLIVHDVNATKIDEIDAGDSADVSAD